MSVGAGAGIVTGLKAGVCVTAEAAKAKGFISWQQVDDLLKAAAQQLAREKSATEAAFTGRDISCEKILADLKQAMRKAK